jgi:DNA-binding transcriptional regulator/RsmH inhibitor MraZ
MTKENRGDLTKIFGCYGTQYVNMDDKGRIVIPTGHRQPNTHPAARGFMMHLTPDNKRILLFPPSELEKIPEATRADMLPLMTFVNIDATGRICIPADLRKGLTERDGMQEHNLVIVGRSSRFEIWTAKEWEGEKPQQMDRFNNAISELTNDQT